MFLWALLSIWIVNWDLSCVAQVPVERTIYLLLAMCDQCTCHFSPNTYTSRLPRDVVRSSIVRIGDLATQNKHVHRLWRCSPTLLIEKPNRSPLLSSPSSILIVNNMRFSYQEKEEKCNPIFLLVFVKRTCYYVFIAHLYFYWLSIFFKLNGLYNLGKFRSLYDLDKFYVLSKTGISYRIKWMISLLNDN